MNDIAIQVENLSKAYQLGKIGTGTISRDLERFFVTKVLGKEDPFLKIGQTNDRTIKGTSDIVWSLKDVNFEIKQGEAVGIIGKNGAGKSTLLKLLSRVTSPTTGNIKVKGRVASLLEVGTGFHPELSGRENIFLNGAILGMRKHEIKRKFDEIVDFAGVERYVDTPVKRYSSGMYVRLAFAVAAHLESEILIVDEVLAVGDAEFQKKCLGKMGDISKDGGRTILFVSHNMTAVKNLCQHSILLNNGMLDRIGTTSDIVPYYHASGNSDETISKVEFPLDKDKQFQFLSIKLVNSVGAEVESATFSTVDDLFVEIEYLFKRDVPKCLLTLIVKNADGEDILFLDRSDYYKEFFIAKKGRYKTRVKIQNPLLKRGDYFLTFGLLDHYSGVNDHKFDVLKFKMDEIESLRNNRQGFLFLPTKWEMQWFEN